MIASLVVLLHFYSNNISVLNNTKLLYIAPTFSRYRLKGSLHRRWRHLWNTSNIGSILKNAVFPGNTWYWKKCFYGRKGIYMRFIMYEFENFNEWFIDFIDITLQLVDVPFFDTAFTAEQTVDVNSWYLRQKRLRQRG